MDRRGNFEGFTLIELCTVLCLIAISIVMIPPAYQRMIQSYRIRTLNYSLSSDIAYTRTLAISKRTQYVMCGRTHLNTCSHTKDWTEGWLVFKDENENRQPDHSSDLLVVQELNQPSEVSINASRPFLRYQKNGAAAHSNLTISLCSRQRVLSQLIVSNTGRARTKTPKTILRC